MKNSLLSDNMVIYHISAKGRFVVTEMNLYYRNPQLFPDKFGGVKLE